MTFADIELLRVDLRETIFRKRVLRVICSFCIAFTATTLWIAATV